MGFQVDVAEPDQILGPARHVLDGVAVGTASRCETAKISKDYHRVGHEGEDTDAGRPH